jgi:RHS repeat-associated protein
MDRLTAKATPEGTLNYTYDAADHVASIASLNSNGASVSYTYDDLDRLSTVTDNRLSGPNTTTYSYDSANNVATVNYPNGVQSTFSYDTQNRVTGLTSQVSGYTYHRGATGNLTSATESTGRTVSWSYDGIYRLTNETISLAPSGHNGSVGYGLDPVGNRLSDTSTLSGINSGTFGYNADDELSSESYDQNGNTTYTDSKSFTYDSENHLMTMSETGTSATVQYDGFGNRVSKTVNGVTTRYLVDDLNPTGLPQVMDELNGSGLVERTYAYGLQRIDENQLISNVWTPSFYGYDGGGSVRQLTGTLGTITDSYDYDAFGNKINSTGTTPNNFLYRGEQYDSDLSLYYLRARYYNPMTGRFVSMDPEEFQPLKSKNKPVDSRKLHRYLYASGDPVNRIDPRGRADLIEDLYLDGEPIEGLNALIRTGKSLAELFACVDDVIEDAYDIDAAFDFCIEEGGL